MTMPGRLTSPLAQPFARHAGRSWGELAGRGSRHRLLAQPLVRGDPLHGLFFPIVANNSGVFEDVQLR